VLWFSTSAADGQPEIILPSMTLAITSECSKEVVVSRVVAQLVGLGLVRAEYESEVVAGILKREALATTAIGKGIALPHTKHPKVEHSVGAIVYLSARVAFDSIDGEPVHTLGVVVSPTDRPKEHLRTLAAMCKDLGGR
jgi:PTS system fructose-specific IIA component/PTS system nitrogen regulatory IIA component